MRFTRRISLIRLFSWCILIFCSKQKRCIRIKPFSCPSHRPIILSDNTHCSSVTPFRVTTSNAASAATGKVKSVLLISEDEVHSVRKVGNSKVESSENGYVKESVNRRLRKRQVILPRTFLSEGETQLAFAFKKESF
jgi:hypothetical protein